MMPDSLNLGWPFLTTNTNNTFPPAPPLPWAAIIKKSRAAIFRMAGITD